MEKECKEIKKYDFAEDSLSVINEGSILSDKDFDKLVEMKDGLKHGFKYGQVFRTDYEARHSVLVDAKFTTPDSKYWQSVREQSVHFGELVSLSFEYRKNVVKLARYKVRKAKWQHKIDSGDYKDNFEKADLELKIKDITIEEERVNWFLANQERTATARMREIEQWHVIKEELLPDMEFGTEDCGAHQHKSYLLRFAKQLEFIKEGQVDMGSSEVFNLLSQLDMAAKLPENRELVGEIYGQKIKNEIED